MAIDLETEVAVDAKIMSDEKFKELLKRLNKQSVDKHFEAFKDIDWENPEMAIDPDDERWILPKDDPLGKTHWYRSLPRSVQSRLGLYRVASAAKIGLQFENVLKRGLLEHAFLLRNCDPSFRYIMHEITEECQHSMMFQEFVDRSGFDIKGLPLHIKIASYFVVIQAIFFPEMFFLFVLGGEDPIDYVQRTLLTKHNNPPILERIMRIHVTEEARHLSFARHYLKNKVPLLSRFRRLRLTVGAPVMLFVMSLSMLYPSKEMIKEFEIPRAVLKEAYKENPEGRDTIKAALAKVRRLWVELNLVGPFTKKIWQLLGIWE